jgi:hypothetical protein
MGIRRWLRRIERDSKETADTMTLLDTETGEEFKVPRYAALDVLANALVDEEDVYDRYPWMKPILPRLNRLVDRDSGQPFFLEDMRHTSRAAANTEEGYAR